MHPLFGIVSTNVDPGRHSAYHQLAKYEGMAVVQGQRPCSGSTNVPAIVTRSQRGLVHVSTPLAHNTSGDLIFSAKRTRLMLFQAYRVVACQHAASSLQTRWCVECTHRGDRGEDARLVSQLLVVLGVIPS